MEKSTDAELMNMVLKRNTRAFKILYSRYEMSKKRYAYHYAEVSEIPFKDEPINPRAEEPDAEIEHADLQNTIARALAKLNPLLREIIILKHYQQLKFKEIAEMTNTPEGTLKARFHRAIAALKELLEPMEL